MLTALAGGAIGALLTGMIAALVWLSGVPGDVEEHDRLTGDRDEDLASWLADEKLRLELEREQIINELNKRGLLHSGERNWQLAKAKERTLHAYRDQERAARRFAAGLAGRERFAHRVYRRWRRRPLKRLTAVDQARPVLDLWREPESYEGSPVLEVNDPTTRSLEDVIVELERSRDPASPA